MLVIQPRGPLVVDPMPFVTQLPMQLGHPQAACACASSSKRASTSDGSIEHRCRRCVARGCRTIRHARRSLASFSSRGQPTASRRALASPHPPSWSDPGSMIPSERYLDGLN